MTKADVIRAWKPELKALGFQYRKGAFYLEPAEGQRIQSLVSIQRNLYAETFKINPTLAMRGPFEPASDAVVLLLANLRPTGVLLHVTTASWWPVDRLAEARLLLERYVPSWFREWAQPQRLADVFEQAIRKRADIIDIAEPLAAELTQVPWRPESPASRRIPPMYYEYASILHYLSGDLPASRARTRDWISSLGSHQHALKTKAQHQLSMLEREA